MQTEQEALKNLTLTLKKYKANKENVDPEELKTKYKIAFDKLKEQLKKETEAYIIIVMFQGMRFYYETEDETVDALMADINKNKIGKMAGRAVFKHYDLEELRQLAVEQRDRNIKIILSHQGLIDPNNLGGGVKADEV